MNNEEKDTITIDLEKCTYTEVVQIIRGLERRLDDTTKEYKNYIDWVQEYFKQLVKDTRHNTIQDIKNSKITIYALEHEGKKQNFVRQEDIVAILDKLDKGESKDEKDE